MTKIATDNSYYQIFSPIQYDIIASGTDGAIVRTGFGLTLDKSRVKHLGEFRDRGTPVSSYWWVDPTRDRNRQIAMIGETTEQLHLPSVFLDAEQWWTDWASYMKQDLATAYLTRFKPDFLNRYYHDVYDGVVKGTSSFETGNYSADWYIDRYAPAMKEWIFDKNYWEARYLRYYNKTALPAIYKQFGKPIDISVLPEFIPHAPIVCGIGRQFESLIYVKDLYAHQDYNFFTDEGFNRMFGTSHPTDPPPPPPPEIPLPEPTKTYVINTFSLRIRSGPSTNYPKVGNYWTGNKVSVLEISGDWGRTDKGWIHLGYTLPIQSSFVVTAAYLTVREFASAYSKAVDWVKFGDHVYEVRTVNGWVDIGRDWVSAKYLKPV